MQLLQWATAGFIVPQRALQQDERSTKVAVIGTGISGAAVTSRLLEVLPEVEIIVFERNASVGGRMINTAHPYGQFQALEGGAALFGTDDQCIVDLLHKHGLQHGSEVPLSELPEGSGFPHKPAAQLSVLCDLETNEWRRLRDLTWRYGLSLWRARRLIASARLQWQSFWKGDALDPALLGPAQQYFAANRISEQLQEEVLQPCAESRSYKHIREGTALSALLSARRTTMTGVVGGNAQIGERIFERSQLKLSTQVLAVVAGSSRRYKLQYRSDTGEDESEFDTVVIATPLTGSNIKLGLQVPEVGYEPRHVTYVASSQSLSSLVQFDYLDVRQLSDSIATTSQASQHDINAVSVRLKCGVHQPEEDDCGSEDIYRIVSRRQLDDGFLMNLINATPGSGNSSLADHGISWVQRYSWPNALPKWNTDASLADVELAPGLFYTAGMEPVVSSLEMGCRMGRHVAEKVQLVFREGMA